MVRKNSYRGDVALKIGGKQYTLKYDWTAVVQLKTEFGKEFDMEVSLAITEMDLPVLAKILAIGLECYQLGKFTDQDILSLSPPIVPIIGAIQKAISCAYYGEGEAPSDRPTIPERMWNVLMTLFGKRRKPRIASA